MLNDQITNVLFPLNCLSQDKAKIFEVTHSNHFYTKNVNNFLVYSLFDYQTPESKKLLTLAKLFGNQEFFNQSTTYLTDFINQYLDKHGLDKSQLLITIIPFDPKRLIQRGFCGNQIMLKKFEQMGFITSELFYKSYAMPNQSLQTKVLRFKNTKNIKINLKNLQTNYSNIKTILVVDDLITSGATFEHSFRLIQEIKDFFINDIALVGLTIFHG
jgi:predicted amidophosphoribosyltransferase